MPAWRLFTGAGTKGTSTFGPPPGAAAPRPPESVDPAASLKLLVKRLRTCTSPVYTQWRQQTLCEMEVTVPP